LQKLESGFEDRILAFDAKAAKVWSQMTVDAEALGKSMAAFDAIIAATARAHGCKLVTRNVRDFTSAGVEMIDPWG
jgi:predicted nucleic acid-binding protein